MGPQFEEELVFNMEDNQNTQPATTVPITFAHVTYSKKQPNPDPEEDLDTYYNYVYKVVNDANPNQITKIGFPSRPTLNGFQEKIKTLFHLQHEVKVFYKDCKDDQIEVLNNEGFQIMNQEFYDREEIQVNILIVQPTPALPSTRARQVDELNLPHPQEQHPLSSRGLYFVSPPKIGTIWNCWMSDHSTLYG